MQSKSMLFMLLIFTSIAGPLFAQEMPKFPEPQEEHEFLQQFVGEWVTHSKAIMGPGAEPMECHGTMSSQGLGKFWAINNLKGDLGGVPINGIQTLGYNLEKKKFVGTWVDSMTDHLWAYEGGLENDGKKLVLEAEGPNYMAGGGSIKYKDTYEFKSPDVIETESLMQGEDGKWVTFMTGTFTRKK